MSRKCPQDKSIHPSYHTYRKLNTRTHPKLQSKLEAELGHVSGLKFPIQCFLCFVLGCRGLNPWPHECQACALPWTEPHTLPIFHTF